MEEKQIILAEDKKTEAFLAEMKAGARRGLSEGIIYALDRCENITIRGKFKESHEDGTVTIELEVPNRDTLTAAIMQHAQDIKHGDKWMKILMALIGEKESEEKQGQPVIVNIDTSHVVLQSDKLQ